MKKTLYLFTLIMFASLFLTAVLALGCAPSNQKVKAATNKIVVGADEPVNHELAVAILEIFREVFPFRVLFGTEYGQDFPERITLFRFGFHYLPSWSALS